MGYNPDNSKSRYNYLHEFLHWLEAQGVLEIEKVSILDIVKYYEYISERPSKTGFGILSQKTTHGHMRNVRDLFIMLQKSELEGQTKIEINPCSTLKFHYPKETEPRIILTQQEIKQLYNATETPQERAILSMSYGCGLRVGELEKCNIEDIRLREKILIIPRGKGNKRRVVPISSEVAKDLSDYYYNQRETLSKERDFKPKDSVFMLHSRGGRMREYTYNKHLKTILKRTKIPREKQDKLSIHSLRHSIATHLLEQGVSVEQVRIFLGHSQLETTQIYTHVSIKLLENVVREHL